MKKLIFWVIGGLTVATISGLAGLPHLSASIVTLTAFCGVPASIVVALNALPRLRVGSGHVLVEIRKRSLPRSRNSAVTVEDSMV